MRNHSSESMWPFCWNNGVCLRDQVNFHTVVPVRWDLKTRKVKGTYEVKGAFTSRSDIFLNSYFQNN